MKRIFHSGQGGQGLVEFAVIFPMFIMLVFVLIDGGFLMGRYNNITNAAKEGARLGAVGATKQEIVARVKAQAHGKLDSVPAAGNCGGYAATGKEICVEWIKGPKGESPGATGASVRVTINYKYQLVTPLINKIGSWKISECAVQRQELGVANPSPTSTETSC